MFYNCKVKHYPDGTKQLMFYEFPKQFDYEVEQKESNGLCVERKEIENASRAKRKVFDYVKCNTFDWFITFTFDDACVNRYDYNSCADALKRYTDLMRHNGNAWVIVAEQHSDGAYHFHGVISGKVNVEPALNPKNGKLLKDKSGRQIYNVKNFKYGFTQATKISDQSKTASYIGTYISEEMAVPKGRKRYWTSRNLCLPQEEMLEMTTEEYGEFFNRASYKKVIPSQWGTYLLCELKENEYEL